MIEDFVLSRFRLTEEQVENSILVQKSPSGFPTVKIALRSELLCYNCPVDIDTLLPSQVQHCCEAGPALGESRAFSANES